MAYILNTAEDQKAMLERIGASGIEELFRAIPDRLRLKRPLDIPVGLSEIELTSHLQELASRNQSASDAICFLGGGAYDHFIPTVVDGIASRSEFYTAYTPYQGEASQGTLQAIYEFQTMVCQLTGLPLANASLYEGGTAIGEAALMASQVTDRTEGKVLIAESVHPEYRQVLATYLHNLPIEMVTVPTPDGAIDVGELNKHLDDRTVCVVTQSPNFFGHLESVQEISDLAHSVGGLSVVSFDPIGLGILKKPADQGADIAVAEGQSLGTPLGFGGPYLGLMACRQEYMRKIPGRLVGETTDRYGNRCWVLALQTREQHIRREKATSNICSNQGLIALRATVYLAALGPQGLKETAELCLKKAHYAAERLGQIPGVKLRFDKPFFKEFTIQVEANAEALLVQLREQGYLGGLALGRWYPELANCISIAVTEKRTRKEIDEFANAVSRAMQNKSSAVNA